MVVLDDSGRTFILYRFRCTIMYANCKGEHWLPILLSFFWCECSSADPYLNTDVDIMSRFKHEEVFVSDAGGKDFDGVCFLRSLLCISTMGFYLRKVLCLQSDCYVS